MNAVRVTLLTPELLRIEYAPESGFSDQPSLFAINAPTGVGNTDTLQVFTTSASSGARPIHVCTSRFDFHYTPDGRPPHAGNMRALIRHASPPAGVATEAQQVLWTPGSQARFNLGGTIETLDGVRGAVGTGEGLLSRDGWHLVDDSGQHLLVDAWAASRESQGLGSNTDWYLFAYGEDYRAAFRSLACIAGRVPLPRRATLGSWYSRYWPYTSDEFRGILLEYRAHGFPLDIMVLDMDWHREGWTGWSWNRALIPDAEDLLSYFHQEGVQVTLNLHPADGVGPHEDRYAAFMRALHTEPDGRVVAFDAAQREYMRALFSELHEPLEHPPGRSRDAGVDFWWLDWQQERFTRSQPALTNLRWLNHLYFQHTSRSRGGVDRATRRGQSFSRWAGWGDHRHPIHFSGDAHTGWRMLAFQVPFTVQAGNVACFYWSHDIGGHFGPRLEETTARWVQFGAVSAALRLHSARSPVLDRRPWSYQERFCESMRRAFELRTRLMPSIYTAARASFDHTLPLLRPMYLACACDDRAYESPHQFLIGDDLLAAPIVSPGVGHRCVATQRAWFPCGCASPASEHDHDQRLGDDWFDLITCERHHAGDEVIVAADIDHFPIFARGGAPIFMQPAAHRCAAPLSEPIIRLFPGSPGSTIARDLYEDDGDSPGYLADEFATTRVTAAWKAASDRDAPDTLRLLLSIDATRGEYAGQSPTRSMVLELAGFSRVDSATLDGQPVELEHDFDDPASVARLRLQHVNIRHAIAFSACCEPADARATTERNRRTLLLAALGSPAPSLAGPLESAIVGAWSLAESPKARAHVLAIGAGIGLAPVEGRVRFVDSLASISPPSVDFEVFDSVQRTRTVLSSVTRPLDNPAGQRAVSFELPQSPMPHTPIGLRASRVVRAKFRIAGSPIEVEAVANTVLPPLSRWALAAPFNWDWRWAIDDHTYEPESQPLDSQATYLGADNRRVGWLAFVPGEKWHVDFLRVTERRAVGFAWTIINSPVAQVATLHFESAGDKTQIFLNGANVFTQSGFDSETAAIESFTIELRSGRNDLLIKTAEGGGGWGFTASVECDLALEEVSPLA